MTQKQTHHHGFTLVELCAVIAILSIIASLAVVAYSKFRTPDYDFEAYSVVHNLYAQAQKNMAEWSVALANANSYQISAGCYYALETPQGSTNTLGNAGIYLPGDGVHHWNYSVCFGFLDDNATIASYIVAAKPNNNFMAGAQRDRFIVFSPAIDEPLTLDSHQNSLPDVVQLKQPGLATFDSLFQ